MNIDFKRFRFFLLFSHNIILEIIIVLRYTNSAQICIIVGIDSLKNLNIIII